MLKTYLKAAFFTTALCTALLVGSINITSAQAASVAPTRFINQIPRTVGIGTRSRVDIHGCNGSSTSCLKNQSWGRGNLWRKTCKMAADLAAAAGNVQNAGKFKVGLASNYTAEPSPSWGGKNPKTKDCCEWAEDPKPGTHSLIYVAKKPLPAICKGKK